ncbi:MAG: histidine phosphatase family protein [Candidatus Micrarchaeota archaeon]|nr:histidine phosphatase family protein [Candidatus Micrarchaeota archaeon]
MDIELTTEGRKQAYVTGKNLKKFGKFDVMFVSPCIRCRQTAEELIKGMNYKPKLVIEERIRERERGAIKILAKKGIRPFIPKNGKDYQSRVNTIIIL